MLWEVVFVGTKISEIRLITDAVSENLVHMGKGIVSEAFYSAYGKE